MSEGQTIERFGQYEKRELANDITLMLQKNGLSFSQAEAVLDLAKEQLKDVQLGQDIVLNFD